MNKKLLFSQFFFYFTIHTSNTSFELLPTDLFNHIYKYFTIQTACRIACVCKKFNQLISSRDKRERCIEKINYMSEKEPIWQDFCPLTFAKNRSTFQRDYPTADLYIPSLVFNQNCTRFVGIGFWYEIKHNRRSYEMPIYITGEITKELEFKTDKNIDGDATTYPFLERPLLLDIPNSSDNYGSMQINGKKRIFPGVCDPERTCFIFISFINRGQGPNAIVMLHGEKTYYDNHKKTLVPFVKLDLENTNNDNNLPKLIKTLDYDNKICFEFLKSSYSIIIETKDGGQNIKLKIPSDLSESLPIPKTTLVPLVNPKEESSSTKDYDNEINNKNPILSESLTTLELHITPKISFSSFFSECITAPIRKFLTPLSTMAKALFTTIRNIMPRPLFYFHNK